LYGSALRSPEPSAWQRVATTTAAAGWRAVRNHLADLGETTADDETCHDCARPAGEFTDDDDPWIPGRPAGVAGADLPVLPRLCAVV